MSYQTFHPTTGSVQTFDENITDDESSPLYPFGKPVFLSSLSVQMAFVRKVWVIFTSELVAVTFTTALLIYMYDWRHFLQRHMWTWWASIGITFILLIALTYKSNDDFQPPWYLIMIYTCFNAYVVGFLVSILRLTFVLDTLILMLVASFSVLAFTYQTSYKFRAKEPIIITSVMILIASIILHPWFFSFADLIPAFSLAWILSLYFILDTWYLMKQMSKDEYLGASMQLYLDLVIPFRIIHHMCELTAEFGEED